MRLRYVVPVGMSVVGGVSVGLVFVAKDVAWKGVWIAVASAALASAVVDASDLADARSRESSVLLMAGVRVGRIHQRLLWIIHSVFDLKLGDELAARLRGLAPAPIDLSLPARIIHHELTRQQLIAKSLAQIDKDLDVAVTLGSMTSEANRFVQLEDHLREAWFMIFVREVAPQNPPYAGDGADLTESAADVWASVHDDYNYFAKRGGPKWPYGGPSPA